MGDKVSIHQKKELKKHIIVSAETASQLEPILRLAIVLSRETSMD